MCAQLETYIQEVFAKGTFSRYCMYITLKFLLADISNHCCYLFEVLHPVNCFRGIPCVFHYRLIFCLLRSTSVLGVPQKNTPHLTGTTITFPYFPTWILYLPIRFEWRNRCLTHWSCFIWEEHWRRVQHCKSGGFIKVTCRSGGEWYIKVGGKEEGGDICWWW